MENELQRLIKSNAAFTPPIRILDGIPRHARTARPAGAPHSIAEELWHLAFWLDLFLRWVRCESLPYPDSAQSGWLTLNSLPDAEWDFLISRFLRGLDDACIFAAMPVADLSKRESTCFEPGGGRLTVYETLVNIAVHNAYHLGRIVQLRQMLGTWPPPGGGDTW